MWLFITFNSALALGIPYFIAMLVLCGVVISENRNPVRTLAWCIALLFLPVTGLLLYLVFGRSLKNTRMVSRRHRRQLKRNDWSRAPHMRRLDVSPEALRLIRLARNLTDAPYTVGGEVEFFIDGETKFNALKDDLRRARKYILMQYFIFEDDRIGGEISRILIDKAREGVHIRVIYDDVGCFNVSKRFFDTMRRAGIEVYPFFQLKFPNLGLKVNWRNHRKLCIIDGLTGYMGGMNIADRYINGGDFDVWRDTHLRIKGPAVASLQYAFAVDWNFMGQPVIDDKPDDPAPNAAHGPVMQVLTGGPTSQWPNLAFLFQQAVSGARRRVYIQTPYFLPTEALLRSLQTVSLSGVDVRIMLPVRSDSAILTQASASYITECLQAGIKIYFYLPGMLHAKMLIIDDEMVSVGSTNIDFRSFEHNFEINMQMFSPELCSNAIEIFHNDLKLCRRVEVSEWKQRPWSQRAAQSLLRLISPVL